MRMICSHCKNDPGCKPNGLWKGFKDGDTGELVCWQCQAEHYRSKAKQLKLERGMLYTEMPVPVNQNFKPH